MSEHVRFPAEVLERAGREVFRASGSPEAEAALVARLLVQASLAGHDSHGILRVHHYMTQLREGLISPGATPSVIREDGATLLLRGHRAYGQVVADRAAREAIARARAHGIAAVGMTDLMHIGRLADYVIACAEAGQVGMLFTASGGSVPLVAPFGGRRGQMATNPVAAAFPSARPYPVVFDMATSVVANGKLRVLKDESRPAPPGWLLDAEGEPTVDPFAVDAGGCLLPLGGAQGYKGYLLAFLVEVLGGILTGGGYIGFRDNPIFNNCSFLLSVDVERFRPLEAFQQEIDGLIAHLKATPGRPGEEVLYPGELEARNERERRAHGIPLAPRTVANLQDELDRFGIDLRLDAHARPARAG